MALRDHEKEIERLVLKKAKNEPRLSALIGTDDGRKKEASISDLLLRTPRHDYDFDDKHGVAYCVTSLWFSGQGEYKFLTILNNELLKTKCISHPSSPITKKKNA